MSIRTVLLLLLLLPTGTWSHSKGLLSRSGDTFLNLEDSLFVFAKSILDLRTTLKLFDYCFKFLLLVTLRCCVTIFMILVPYHAKLEQKKLTEIENIIGVLRALQRWSKS